MIALQILALHMMGDFVIQNDWMAKRKFTSRLVLTLHVLTYTALFAASAFLQHWPWWVPVLVFVTHWITDSRRWASDKYWSCKPIMVDQTIHIVTLAIIFSWAGIK